jgi:hypothetical protein
LAKPKLAYGSRSLAAFGTLMVAVQVFHPAMLSILQAGETAAWLSALLSAVLTALLVWPVGKVLERIPGGNVMDLVRIALGDFGEIAAALVLGAIIAHRGGIYLRETSEMATTAVFPHTPQTFGTTTILLGAAYVAWGDGASLVHHGRMVLFGFLCAVLLILAGTFGWGEFRYLTPVLGPGLGKLLAGLPQVSSLYVAALLPLLFADGVERREGLARWISVVPLSGGIIFAAVVLVLLIVFPFPGGLNIGAPLHSAARLVLGGRFFERLEGFWLFAWVETTILLLGAMLMGAATAFAKAFRMDRHRTAVLPLAALMLTFAFFPHDQAETIEALHSSAFIAFVIMIPVPAVVAGIAYLRLRGRPS